MLIRAFEKKIKEDKNLWATFWQFGKDYIGWAMALVFVLTARDAYLIFSTPFIFLAVVIVLVRHFEKEIKRGKLGDWRNEKLK